jgi:HK97 family phage major capsid protein
MTPTRLHFNRAFQIALQNRNVAPDIAGAESVDLRRHLKIVAEEASGIVNFAEGRSFCISTGMLTRDLSVSVPTAGGDLVSTSKPSLIDLLRPFSAIASLSPTVLNGLTSNVSLPAVTVGAVTGWSAENAALTGVGDPVFALPVTLTPHLVSAQVKISRKLILSTGFDFQAGILRELYAALGGALDQAALLGNGPGNAPVGILSAPGTNALTFGAAASWPNILKFETAIGKANAPKDKLAWLGSNNTREKLKQAVKSTGNSNFIWQNGQIADYRAEATSWLDTTDQLIFGSWDNLVIGLWLDGIQLTVDEFTGATTNQVKITATVYADIGLLRPALFSVSTDSAAQ